MGLAAHTCKPLPRCSSRARWGLGTAVLRHSGLGHETPEEASFPRCLPRFATNATNPSPFPRGQHGALKGWDRGACKESQCPRERSIRTFWPNAIVGKISLGIQPPGENRDAEAAEGQGRHPTGSGKQAVETRPWCHQSFSNWAGGL